MTVGTTISEAEREIIFRPGWFWWTFPFESEFETCSLFLYILWPIDSGAEDLCGIAEKSLTELILDKKLEKSSTLNKKN